MWQRIVLCLIFAVSSSLGGTLEQRILAPSVTVSAGSGTGSGVIFTRGDRCFVLTAGHVVAPLREVVTKLEAGIEKKYEKFKDASVVVVLYEKDRKVGKVEMDAEILAYSSTDDGEDLALLEVRKKAFIKETAVFHLEDSAVSIGTRLYHCGSLQGEMGSNSLTNGIVSRVGRLYNGKLYDQSSVTAFPGSSGGGVFTEDGVYVGMITRGAGETFNLFIPSRRIVEWLKTTNLLWVVDPKLAIPSPAEAPKEKKQP